MPPFRVVLADHQTLLLQSIRKNLGEMPDIEVDEIVYAGPELLESLKKSPTDMMILDVGNLEQLAMVETVKRIYPEVKIFVLATAESEELLLHAILARADGYLLKENAYSELITAINKIYHGGNYYCPIISGIMADIIRNKYSKVVRKKLSTKQIKITLMSLAPRM